MQVQGIFVVFFLCGLGKALVLCERRSSNTTMPSSTIATTKEAQLKTKHRKKMTQDRFFNKSVNLNEAQKQRKNTTVVYRNYTQTLHRGFELFQQIFGPYLRRRNRQRNVKNEFQKCTVSHEKRNMGRHIFPRHVKIGVCGASPCSSRDVTCSCQPSKIAFKYIIIKICQGRRRRKRPHKSSEQRKISTKGRRCTWKNEVILSAVACECRCQKH